VFPKKRNSKENYQKICVFLVVRSTSSCDLFHSLRFLFSLTLAFDHYSTYCNCSLVSNTQPSSPLPSMQTPFAKLREAPLYCVNLCASHANLHVVLPAPTTFSNVEHPTPHTSAIILLVPKLHCVVPFILHIATIDILHRIFSKVYFCSPG